MYKEAGMLQGIVCANFWTAHRKCQMRSDSTGMCPRCLKEPETAQHRYWQCEHNAILEQRWNEQNCATPYLNDPLGSGSKPKQNFDNENEDTFNEFNHQVESQPGEDELISACPRGLCLEESSGQQNTQQAGPWGKHKPKLNFDDEDEDRRRRRRCRRGRRAARRSSSFESKFIF